MNFNKKLNNCVNSTNNHASIDKNNNNKYKKGEIIFHKRKILLSELNYIFGLILKIFKYEKYYPNEMKEYEKTFYGNSDKNFNFSQKENINLNVKSNKDIVLNKKFAYSELQNFFFKNKIFFDKENFNLITKSKSSNFLLNQVKLWISFIIVLKDKKISFNKNESNNIYDQINYILKVFENSLKNKIDKIFLFEFFLIFLSEQNTLMLLNSELYENHNLKSIKNNFFDFENPENEIYIPKDFIDFYKKYQLFLKENLILSENFNENKNNNTNNSLISNNSNLNKIKNILPNTNDYSKYSYTNLLNYDYNPNDLDYNNIPNENDMIVSENKDLRDKKIILKSELENLIKKKDDNYEKNIIDKPNINAITKQINKNDNFCNLIDEKFQLESVKSKKSENNRDYIFLSKNLNSNNSFKNNYDFNNNLILNNSDSFYNFNNLNMNNSDFAGIINKTEFSFFTKDKTEDSQFFLKYDKMNSLDSDMVNINLKNSLEGNFHNNAKHHKNFEIEINDNLNDFKNKNKYSNDIDNKSEEKLKNIEVNMNEIFKEELLDINLNNIYENDKNENFISNFEAKKSIKKTLNFESEKNFNRNRTNSFSNNDSDKLNFNNTLNDDNLYNRNKNENFIFFKSENEKIDQDDKKHIYRNPFEVNLNKNILNDSKKNNKNFSDSKSFINLFNKNLNLLLENSNNQNKNCYNSHFLIDEDTNEENLSKSINYIENKSEVKVKKELSCPIEKFEYDEKEYDKNDRLNLENTKFSNIKIEEKIEKQNFLALDLIKINIPANKNNLDYYDDNNNLVKENYIRDINLKSPTLMNYLKPSNKSKEEFKTDINQQFFYFKNVEKIKTREKDILNNSDEYSEKKYQECNKLNELYLEENYYKNLKNNDIHFRKNNKNKYIEDKNKINLNLNEKFGKFSKINYDDTENLKTPEKSILIKKYAEPYEDYRKSVMNKKKKNS